MAQPPPAEEGQQLERGSYEIIRNRMLAQGQDLRGRLEQLNAARREVFGSIETRLVATERITTEHNCVARDLVSLGEHFIFGYNVQFGLKTETHLEDVFAIKRLQDETFHDEPLELLANEQFHNDFKQLYKYYRGARFAKFVVAGPHLYMVFRVGRTAADIKSFKWLMEGDKLTYLDNRSDHEVRFPPQHEFEWVRTNRDQHRGGEHPHIAIEDRLFVETVGGDLTIKIEDNTASGEGIYAEPVENADQVLDDAEIFYASLGNVILLKIRPYQEDAFRYFVFNEKIQQVLRLDAIEHACVMLPEDHGLIFSNGYYLQTGEYKTFANDLSDLLFEKRIASPNGEDYLYVFYNREEGVYVLLSYNVIEQRVETPVICNGYLIFDDGRMCFFRADPEPQKHHAVQIWQTPYTGTTFVPQAETDSLLYKIGNKDIVRGMAECHEILSLLEKDESYANLYVDLMKKATTVVDSYFWMPEEDAANLAKPLTGIREAAAAAVEEFDKVVRVRKNTQKQFGQVSDKAAEELSHVHSRMYQEIGDFVASLASLRTLRGEIIGLRDLRYVDLQAVDELEEKTAGAAEKTARRAVEFLLRPDALEPYAAAVKSQHAKIDTLEKVKDAKEHGAAIDGSGQELEMLIDVVSNLDIDDATQRTEIIDNISSIYSNVNQARAALKKKTQQLLAVESAAEFGSQMKLIGQAVVNYLDVADEPARCDEYLTKVMVQVEELEGRFAEFDEFIVQISEKREEIYAAFDSRKLALVEARNRRAAALGSAADRILKGVATRAGKIDSVNGIHSYFASDLMIEKVRDIVDELTTLEDSVRVDDIQSRLKSIREDAVRQLKDKQELFVDGANVIRFGEHKFTVNVQPLDLTSVVKDGQMCFHLTGTRFMEPVEDERITSRKAMWDQQSVSENAEVYRGEYLAFKLFQQTAGQGATAVNELRGMDEPQLLEAVQKFMAPRYSEGYVKGVHDHDAAKLLTELLRLHTTLGLARYPADARGLAWLAWQAADETLRQRQHAQLRGIGAVRDLFDSGAAVAGGSYLHELRELIAQFLDAASGDTDFISVEHVPAAAQYLFDELTSDDKFSAGGDAWEISRALHQHLERRGSGGRFADSLQNLDGDLLSQFRLARDWVTAYLAEFPAESGHRSLNEAAVLLLDEEAKDRHMLHASPVATIEGLLGDHPRLEGGDYQLNYQDFMTRLSHYDSITAPQFIEFTALKSQLLDEKREEMRLEEFKPRVLTSFVRNKLIDEVYLPMVGENLAKQIGAAGDQKRTDLMGLLLLVSPPGYGKTTLMEYIANRLGITFMKINGPAIGHQVTSLDPAEAPNASAREEVEKLNLALEMGDNIMLYLDDIQHCNPEFLQKFISLCDGQRRIEGVYRGRTRTYDLRGRKVAVVMAGNPYTESGEKFQIPDMLSNRADTYNLGDVIGDKARAFELSYLENCLTSSPALQVLASRSQKDVYGIIRIAETGSPEGVQLEGGYAVDEVNGFVSVMKKLMRVRDVLLMVNQQYIESAAQADEYRTEPPFKLQGSYRDMNKIAASVAAVMNDDELQTLIESHFVNQAQTLTSGAEANLLKFHELMGDMSEEQAARWAEIKRTFKRNLLLGGAGDDKIGQVIAQLTTFSEGLSDIRTAVEDGVQQLTTPRDEGDATTAQIEAAVTHLATFNQQLAGIKQWLEVRENNEQKPLQVVNRVPRSFLQVIETQFEIMKTWMQPITHLVETSNQNSGELKDAVQSISGQYQQLLTQLQEAANRQK